MLAPLVVLEVWLIMNDPWLILALALAAVLYAVANNMGAIVVYLSSRKHQETTNVALKSNALTLDRIEASTNGNLTEIQAQLAASLQEVAALKAHIMGGASGPSGPTGPSSSTPPAALS